MSRSYEDRGQLIVPKASFDGPESVEPESRTSAVGVDSVDKSSSPASTWASTKPYPSMPTGVMIWHKGSLVDALIDTGVACAMEPLSIAGIFEYCDQLQNFGRSMVFLAEEKMAVVKLSHH